MYDPYLQLTHTSQSNEETDNPYSRLSDRIILYNPHRIKHIVSYGSIVIHQPSNKVIIVQRKYSPDFINFIKGWYRKSILYDLFSEMTEQEIKWIKQSMERPERFIALYNNVSPDGDATYATTRFEDNQERIWRLCTTIRGKYESEWLFPKGKLDATDTSIVECAKREFLEETGLTYIPETPITDSPIVYYHKSVTGFIYETKLWVFVVDFQEPPTFPFNNFEIIQRKWVSRGDLNLYLDQSKMSIVDEAFRLLVINNLADN
jgi:8-oxo-dGTP pyrophosphatase MutT (NUDIX family)